MLREISKQETRDTIIDAAERLLDHYGYAKMTMTDLAEEANIGVGTTYLYFPSKVDVALAVLERLTARVRERLQEIAHSPLAPTEKLRSMLTERLTIRYESARTRHHQIDDFKRAVQSEVDQRRAGWLAAEAEIIAAVLEEGRLTGDFRYEDATNTAAALLRATSSLMPRSLTHMSLSSRRSFNSKSDKSSAFSYKA